MSVLANPDEHMDQSGAALRNQAADTSDAEQEHWVTTTGLVCLLLAWSSKRDLACQSFR